MTVKLTPRKKLFVDTASEMFGAAAVLTKAETKEAADKAIEQDRCAVGLTDVTADSEAFAFLFGYVKYTIEGDLIIDKSKPGCEHWKM